MRAWSRINWQVRKAARGLRRAATRRLYRDELGDPARSIVVAGAGRSGTTWLADLICSELHARLMFEPFHARLVTEFRRFHYFQYMRPQDEDPELLDFTRCVLTGEIRHPWIDRQVEVLRPRRRLVKDIRACLLLSWLHERFPQVPLVFVARHPCAVVASRLSLRWDTDGDIEPLLAQPELVADHLKDRLDLIRSLRTDEEKHAVVWAVSNLVPLQQFAEGGLTVVFYERLWSDPARELSRVFGLLGRQVTPALMDRVRRPSTTSRGHSAVVVGEDVITRWRKVLSAEEAARVLAVVDRFGLGDLYGDSDLPLEGGLASVAGSGPGSVKGSVS